MTIKGAIGELLGPQNYAKLQALRHHRRSETTLRIGNFDLTFPPDHILPTIQKNLAYRNLALGVAAGSIAKKYPGEPFLDVGANVGDTAAIVATHSDAPMILVEPSDLYFEFLKRNTQNLPNQITLHKAMVAGDEKPNGSLVHINGTAYFDGSREAEACVPFKRLEDFGTPCLIKIDTDGFDFQIIRASLPFLAKSRSALYFENAIYSWDDLQAANAVVTDLEKIGYRRFSIFDAGGLHIATTSEPTVVCDLNRFLLKVINSPVQRHLYYYDILCLSEADADVSAAVSKYFRQ